MSEGGRTGAGEPRLAGRTALVTGGGKAIGRATALRLAAEGAAVAICGRDPGAIEETVAAIEATGGRALGRSLDVSDEAAVDAFTAETISVFGGVEILVNNAALTAMSNLPMANLLDMTTEEWRRTIDINLGGVFFASRAAGRWMRDNRRGAIINISSVHAHVPHGPTPHYDAAKAAIEALTRNLALALGPYDVRVNAVAPGPIQGSGPGHDEISAEARLRQRHNTALGRTGRPEEMAAVIAFLASDDASYVTGHTIVADGGFLLRHGAMSNGVD